MRITACKNCETRYRGRYCPCCGQKATVGKLSWRTFADNFAYSIINLDRGVLFTIKELFTRPGYMMKDFLAGKRARYFPPFSLLIVLAGLYALFSYYIFPEAESLYPKGKTVRVEKEEITDSTAAPVTDMLPVLTPEPEFPAPVKKSIAPQKDPAQKIVDISGPVNLKIDERDLPSAESSLLLMFIRDKLLHSPVLLPLTILFLFALVTPKVFRKNGGKDYNLVEYLFIGAYMTSQRYLVDFVLLPYQFFTAGVSWTPNADFLMILSYFGLTVWNYKQFFALRWGKAIRKTIWLYLATCLLIIILSLLIGALVILIFIAMGK